MRLSRTEWHVLTLLAEGKETIVEIADALQKSQKQVYRVAATLTKKGLADRHRGGLTPTRTSRTASLLKLTQRHPQLSPLLSGSGIPLLTLLLEPRTVEELTQLTGLTKDMVYKKLHAAKTMSVVTAKETNYVVNARLWDELALALQEIKQYDESVDYRVPVGATIYRRTENDVLFSTKMEQPATRTAFSAYNEHGIKLLLHIQFYTLPKRTLSPVDIFKHSLIIAAKEKDTRYYTYAALFYLKHKQTLHAVKHPLIDTITTILSGEHVTGFPTKEEIMERASMYDIRL